MTLTGSLREYRYHFLLVLVVVAALYWNIVPPMVADWYNDENYSHGFIVPLVAGYFTYIRREELAEALVAPSGAGLAVVLLALAQLTVAWLGTEYFLMRSSLVVLIAGMVLYLFGSAVFRLLFLPVLYLFFMVPLPYILYDAVAFPLKLFVTKVSVKTLQLMGVVVLREGNIIMFPSTTLEVADACSGIRSLVSLLALAVAYACMMTKSPLRRWVIVLSAVPIAICTNALRVIATGVLAQYWGARAAEGFFHEFAGLAVFAVAMVLLVGVGALLKTKDHGEGDGK
ncbi:exosortase/archaeosortase family protein [Geobacter sulfurreducens]|uniref:exosortase A n=1 Tax=Geobacter sulfurreducens TaxID=35554 RepID=UPI001BDCAB15|nr:exosortase A [Geobacter sulfurreducens]QVW33897.1 exosortase/archaeosortase family protein [Geobacter sulfurreducens]